MKAVQRLLLASLLVALSVPLSLAWAAAVSPTVPTPLAGWTHSPRFTPDDFAQQNGILLSGRKIVRSSPVVGEIDANTNDGKEMAVGGLDGMLYVYRANGQQLWSKNVLPDPSCSNNDGDGRINSAPVIGQLFGDGVPYVLVGYGTIGPSTCDGGVVVYDGRNGNQKWRFSLRDWAAKQNYKEDLYGVTSSPAVADADGDGKLEIGFGGFDRNIYLLSADSTVRWYYHAADTVWSSPTFVNADSDPQLELVVGSDVSENLSVNPPAREGGFVYSFDVNPRPGLLLESNTGYNWRAFFDQAIYSSPVIADVLSSNPGPEIIIGASCSSDKGGNWIKLLRLGDGATLQTLNAPSCIPSSAAVADIDDDGKLEVVATVMGAQDVAGMIDYNKGSRSRVIAWNPTTGAVLWSVTPTDSNSGLNDAFGADLQSPVIADLDGNGSLEVIVANFWSLIMLDGKSGRQLTCANSVSCGTTLAVSAAEMVKSTPAVADLNGDGKLELIMGGGHIFNNNHGMLYAWTNFAGILGSPAGKQAAYSAPWPMFRGDATHSGVYGGPQAFTPAATTTPVLVVNGPYHVALPLIRH